MPRPSAAADPAGTESAAAAEIAARAATATTKRGSFTMILSLGDRLRLLAGGVVRRQECVVEDEAADAVAEGEPGVVVESGVLSGVDAA
jgi:hypothetical protein